MLSIQDFIRKDKGIEKFGLKTLNDKELRLLQISLLTMYKDVMSFCQKHGIKVALAGGSALGSVRHNGFIPWDDDIDLMMLRDDYTKFIELFEEEMGDKYGLASPSRHSKYKFHNVQVINLSTRERGIMDQSSFKYPGICIDINAIDFVPNNSFLYVLKGVSCDAFFFLLNSKMMYECRTRISDKLFLSSPLSMSYYLFRLFIGLLLFPFSYETLCFYYDKLISSSKKTSRTSIPPGRDHYFKETRATTAMIPFREGVFMGELAYLPNDVNLYLRKMYGDNYMEVPPAGKREPHAIVELTL